MADHGTDKGFANGSSGGPDDDDASETRLPGDAEQSNVAAAEGEATHEEWSEPYVSGEATLRASREHRNFCHCRASLAECCRLSTRAAFAVPHHQRM